MRTKNILMTASFPGPLTPLRHGLPLTCPLRVLALLYTSLSSSSEAEASSSSLSSSAEEEAKTEDGAIRSLSSPGDDDEEDPDHPLITPPPPPPLTPPFHLPSLPVPAPHLKRDRRRQAQQGLPCSTSRHHTNPGDLDRRGHT